MCVLGALTKNGLVLIDAHIYLSPVATIRIAKVALSLPWSLATPIDAGWVSGSGQQQDAADLRVQLADYAASTTCLAF
jgi:hypothetical protein